MCTAVELTQIQTLILHLQRLGFVRHNPGHKLFSLQPPLRPLLLSIAQHEADLYSSSVLGLAQCCLEVCSLASAIFASHAEVSLDLFASYTEVSILWTTLCMTRSARHSMRLMFLCTQHTLHAQHASQQLGI